MVALDLRVEGADVGERHVVDVSDHSREAFGVGDAEGAGESVVVGALVESLRGECQLVAADHDNGMNVDGIEAGLLVGNEVLGELEREIFGGGISHLYVIEVRLGDWLEAVVGSPNLIGACVGGHRDEGCG